MFESAELGHRIDKASFRLEVPKLRAALLDAQFELLEKSTFPVLILASGVDGAGKGETINLLYEWMDPRYLSTQAFSPPSEEESRHPYMWQFWKALPPKGRIGIFAGSWYSAPIADRIAKRSSPADLDQRMAQINHFEAMLANEGALILKFWFHLSKDAQYKRLKSLEKDPKTAWRVTKESWNRLKTYGKLREVAGQVLRTTNTAWAPWMLIEGTDDRYRSLTVGKMILEALQKRLHETREYHLPVAPPVALPNTDKRDILNTLKLDQTLDNKQYKLELAHWQGRLSELLRHPKFQKHALVLAFEGMDAAGKGGSIRRVTAAMDARQYQIVPIAAPTEEERSQPYLWRFWRHIPKFGRVTIFDRTWYGRVLVERVEGFCRESDWLRAFAEINDFEHELQQDGVIVIKFWLQISEAEQLKRFKEREKIAFKRFKITAEDWRNREKSAAYHQAVCEMVDRTSTVQSPWVLIEANHKNFARVKILKTICERLARALSSSIEKTEEKDRS